MDATMWNERYRGTEMVWSLRPNGFVESICRDLPPGRSIDLAAGEGRNAIWLAERGWDSTAVDFSAVAIEKALQIADQRGVEITGVVADLDTYMPSASGYDLVVVAYLQVVGDRLAPMLRRAASAVAPDGRFVLVNHDAQNLEHGHGGPQDIRVLSTPDQVVAALGDGFEIERAEVAERHVATDDGERVALDTVVVAHRHPAG